MKKYFFMAVVGAAVMFYGSHLRADGNPTNDFFVCHSASDPYECAYYLSQYNEAKTEIPLKHDHAGGFREKASVCAQYAKLILNPISLTIGLPVVVALLPIHVFMGIVCLISHAREEKNASPVDAQSERDCPISKDAL